MDIQNCKLSKHNYYTKNYICIFFILHERRPIPSRNIDFLGCRFASLSCVSGSEKSSLETNKFSFFHLENCLWLLNINPLSNFQKWQGHLYPNTDYGGPEKA